jgi:hypothetical protein
MEMYSEKELIEFANKCIHSRLGKIPSLGKDYDYYTVKDAELQNWKETLKQKRREQKINDILNGN